MTAHNRDWDSDYSETAAHTDGTGKRSFDRGQLLLGLLVLLAIVASVIMLIVDSTTGLKVALLAALWAAILGVFLAGRYRREVDEAYDELTYTEENFRLELERSQAVRLANEASRAPMVSGSPNVPPAPAEVHLSDEDMAVLGEIRTSLDELRSQIEDLRGRVLETEPAALRAEAWRLQELESRIPQSASEAGDRGAGHVDNVGNISGAPSVDAVSGRIGAEETPISPELARLLAAEEAARNQKRTQASKSTEATGAPQAETPEDAEIIETTDEDVDADPAHEAGWGTGRTPSPSAPSSPSYPATDGFAVPGGYWSTTPASTPTTSFATPSSAVPAPTPAAEPVPESTGGHRRRGEDEQTQASTSSAPWRVVDSAAKGSHRRDDQGAHGASEPAEDKVPAKETNQVNEPAPVKDRRRRRADENSEGLSVAELLARRKN